MDNQENIIFEGEIYFPIKHQNFVNTDLVISTSGKILNKKTNRLRKIQVNGDFCFSNRKKVNVGRLVGLTFMTGDIDVNENDYKVLSKKKIKHLDGNNGNNNINNLSW
jgi:hypothetical protein